MIGASTRRLTGPYRKNSSHKGLRQYCVCAAAVSLAMCGIAHTTLAQSLTWDSSGMSPVNPIDGSGPWDTTSLLWSNGATDVVWPNDTTVAVFGNGGTAGTVTLAGPINAGGITFNPSTGTYTIAGNTLTLLGTAPTITMNNNAKITSILAGSSGLTLAGTGTLTVTGVNTFTGGLNISGGIYNFTNDNQLGAVPGSATAGNIIINGGILQEIGATVTINTNRGIAIGPTTGTGTATINASTGSMTYAGTITNNGAGSGSLIVNGYLSLQGTNTYSGTTTVNGSGAASSSGQLILGSSSLLTATTGITIDNGASVQDGSGTTSTNNTFLSGRIAAGIPLALGGGAGLVKGGTFTLLDAATGTVNQSIGALTVLPGYNTITGSGNVTTGGTVAFAGGANGYVRSGAAAVLNINYADPISLSASFVAAPTGGGVSGTGTSAILVGAFFVQPHFNQADLVQAKAGVLAAPTYTPNSWSTNSNTSVQGAGLTVGTSSLTTNAVVFNNAPGTVTIPAGNTAVIASGMILENSGLGAASGANFMGGNLTSGNGSDIVFGNFDPAAPSPNVTVNSVITDNGSTSIGLTKTGALSPPASAALVLTASNTYTGPTTIDYGLVQLNNANAITKSTVNLFVTNGLTFGPSGGTTAITSTTIGGLSGSSSESLRNLNSTVGGVILSVGNNNQNTTYSGVLSGTNGGLTKIGTGTLTMTGVSTYTGPTVVNGGTLQFTGGGSINSSSSYNIASGTLDTGGSLALTGTKVISGSGTVLGAVSLATGTTISPGTSSGIGTLTISPSASASGLTFSSGSTLISTLGMPGTTNTGTGSLVAVNGNLTLPSSGLTLKLLDNAGANGQGSIEAGLYDLISYTGTETGFNPSTTFNAVTSSPLVGRTYTFINQNNQIDLLIGAGTLSLTFTGQDNGTGAADSLLGGNPATNFANGATPAAYNDPNSLTFTDTNAVTGGPITNSNVTIAASGVSPATIAFNNSSVNYTVSNLGGGTIGFGGASTSFTKNGTGLVFLQSPNTFGGAVAINAGAVNLANGSALGGTPSVTVASGAALQMQSSSGISVSNPLSLSGTGLAATPAGALDSISGANTYTGTVTLTGGGATIEADAGSLALTAASAVTGASQTLTIAGAGSETISGIISTGSGSLIKTGTGTLTLSGANTFTGGTNLSAGTLNIASDSALGTAGSGAATNLTFSGNSTLQVGAPTIGLNANRNIAIAAGVTVTLDTAGNTLTIPGAISGGDGVSNIVKISPGSLILTGASTYAGGTVVNAGTVSIGNPRALGTGAVTLAGTSPTLQVLPAAGSSTSGFGGPTHTGYTVVVGAEPPFGQPAPVVTTTGSVDTLMLTTSNTSPNGSFENRAIWKNTQVPYATGFQASFVYQNVGGSANGMTFTLETTGTTGVVGGFGTSLGYSGGGQQLTVPSPSAAFAWQVNGVSVVGPGSNGTLGTFATTGGGVNLATSDPFQFLISGSGTSNQFAYTITDLNNTSKTTTGTVTLTNTLTGLLGNGGNAYVGFTGGTTAANNVAQNVSNFSYVTGFVGAFSAANNVNVTTNSTIDVSYGSATSFGALTIGSNTLNFTNASNNTGGASLAFGTANVTGAPVFAPAANVAVSLGALNDAGTASTITVAGGASTGSVNLTSPATSFVAGSLVNVASGTLLVSNGTNGSATGAAPVNVSSGAFVGGNGTIGGVLTVASGGSVFVGPTNNTAGKVAGTLYIGSGSSLLGSTLLDLTAPSTNDEIVVGGGTGAVTLGGSLIVTNPNTFNFSGGQTYTLLGFGSEAGTFSTAISLPPLPSGLSWNTGALYTSGTISITGTTGATDIGTGFLILHNASLAAVTAQAQSGYNNGAWNGSSGIVSSAAAADTAHLTAVGVIQNSVDGTPTGTPLYTTFEGQPAVDTDVLVKYTYYGDANLDGKVDGTDYSRIDNAFANNQNGSNPQLTGWYNGDFNYDGVINGSDYTLIDNAFNQQGAQIAAAVAAQVSGLGGSSAVPEPATLSLIGMSAIGLLARRRRAN